jgi:hypothetical protein
MPTAVWRASVPWLAARMCSLSLSLSLYPYPGSQPALNRGSLLARWLAASVPCFNTRRGARPCDALGPRVVPAGHACDALQHVLARAQGTPTEQRREAGARSRGAQQGRALTDGAGGALRHHVVVEDQDAQHLPPRRRASAHN